MRQGRFGFLGITRLLDGMKKPPPGLLPLEAVAYTFL